MVLAGAEVYSELSRTSKVDLFVRIVDGFQRLTIFGKYGILDDLQDFQNAFELYVKLLK